MSLRKEKLVSCVISYSGGLYHGFARQVGCRSVEEVLSRAVASIANHPVKLKVAGRTDSGVHAAGQVVSFTAQLPKISPEQLTRAVNSLLPNDIRVLNSCFQKKPFDARRDARSRVYFYHVVNGPASVFMRPYSINIEAPLNLKKMQKAAQFLVGRRDFAALAAAGSDFKTTTRHLLRIEIKVKKIKDWLWIFGQKIKEVRIFQFIIEANAFLYKMCRNLIGFLIEVGLGRLPVASAKTILSVPKGIFKFKPAPARALVLVKINY